MKTVLITKEFGQIDKRRWPQYVKDFIDNPDINSIHPRRGSKIAYHKFNTDAYPRFVFFEEKDDYGNIIYVIRKYFENHDSYERYDHLSEEQKIQKCKYSHQDEEDLNHEFAKFIEDVRKDPLPDEMRDYEKMRDFSNTATTYVFEMEEWCSHINRKELEDDCKEIFSTIQDVVINKIACDCDHNGWYSIKFADNKEIVYRVHEFEDHVYYYMFDIGTEIDKSKLFKKYINLNDERLLKQAHKGYPDWILCGKLEDWKKLENDDEANLALSDEEIKVLNGAPYPYFINGLAGSGKSTILYYLFSHAYSYKEVKPLDLLFLSYSPKLISKAKSVIKALLNRNPSYHDFKMTKDEEIQLEKCFWPFQQFLTTNFLDTEDEQTFFTYENHLSYDEFQKDYVLNCKLNEAKVYKAAMVWSVIRSFIKGRDYKAVFTIDAYKNLPKSDRTVEVSDYENIYRIWKNWYKPAYDGKRWDDLDLIRHILNKMDAGFKFKKYDIIYCDEAQDFTVIENNLILRLSKYTDFDLKGYKKIPIAYAGDPNQTVNPTGFNWKRLKEIFDNTFANLVGDHIKLEEQPLNNNYRSKKTIVEFANSLQYIRKSFLTDDGDVLKPQEQWNPQANPTPGFFFLTKSDGGEDDTQTIKKGFEKTECIITGADGEYERQLEGNDLTEDSTIIDDDLLASIDNKTKLYTAISSKGLEFKAVLLYRFADYLPKSFTKILSKEELDDESDRYELAHFFTKLYIAVSRAKEVLYIADTQDNYDKFWKFFINNCYVQDLMSDKQDVNVWEGKIGGIEIGNKDEYLRRMEENFQPWETAIKIFEDAKIDENPKNMKRASGYFEEAGDFSEAAKCKAYVLLYEKNYLQAGRKFRDLGLEDMATKAFWKGSCWEELVNHNLAVYRLSSLFMTGKMSVVELMKNYTIIDKFNSLDETWNKVVIEINKQAANVSPDYYFTTCQFLERIESRGFKVLKPTIADLYFKCEQYSIAIRKWDELASVNNDSRYREHQNYYLAKEKSCSTTSEAIFWMHKGGKDNAILEHYSTPDDVRVYLLDERAKRIIFSLLLKPETFTKALTYPVQFEDKLTSLYKTDKFQFIEHYVLKDFDEEKFVKWIENPLKNEESDLFDREIPIALFEKIFNLPMAYGWIFFMKLKDNGGYRVMRNDVNINRVSDALSNVLSSRNNIALASCFLDVVFNSPYYNYANAHKHIGTLLNIFDKNSFTYSDFIAVSRTNRYFAASELTGHELDIIKDRLREFIMTKIKSYKKIKDSDLSTVKTLCLIYEKVVPQKQNETGKYRYDWENVLKFYQSLGKQYKVPKEFVDFIKIRSAVVVARHKNRQTLSKMIESLGNTVSMNDVIATFDRDDAVWFIGFAFGKKTVNLSSVGEFGLSVAKLIYNNNILLSDFSRKEVKENLKSNFEVLADKSINVLLSKDKIDEFALKMYAYLYEVFMDSSKDKAYKYDTIAKSRRLLKLHRLVTYLHIRSLHFNSYGDERHYVDLAKEYEQSLSIEDARKKIRPIIEEKPSTELSGKITNIGKFIEKQDVAKKAQLEVAKNLKANGIPNEIILKSAPLLTLEDIKSL